LLKVDVEGFEPRVVRGAARLLNGPTPPGILLEWNPMAMSEVRTSPQDLLSSTSGFDFYYVDDFEGQRRPFGDKVPDLAKIDWVCNIFAIPASSARWSSTIARARELLAGS
jgi:hypothetical protein